MVVGIPPLLSYFVQPVIETACRLIICHVVQALVLLQKPQADEVLERLLRWIEVGSPVVSGMWCWRRVGRVGPKRVAVRPVACRSWTLRNATAGGPDGGRIRVGRDFRHRAC